MFPLKIAVDNSYKLMLYFLETQARDRCLEAIIHEQGFSNQLD
jgi:hypothetical protein